MDGQNPAPPKRPWRNDSPVDTNKQWLPVVSKWCRIMSIHSILTTAASKTSGRAGFVSEAVFLDAAGRRVGGFYRLEAAEAFLAAGGSRCPVTNQPVAKVQEVPSILEDGLAFFFFFV